MTPQRTRTLRLKAGAVLFGLLWAAGGCHGPAEPPLFSGPIIIFDIDTLRADHLGCYGYSRPTSPNIDRLARDSFRFEWAFSQSPSTGPSHSSIFTGLYPSTHGVKNNGKKLADSAYTLAESLYDAGYRTAALVDGGYMSPSFNLKQGFEHYQDFHYMGFRSFGPQVVDFLKEYGHLNLFLLVHTYDVHAPYTPPEPYFSMFSGDIQPSPGFVPTIKNLEKARHSAWNGQSNPLPPADLEYAKACYDGGIRFVDHWIGLFMDEIKRSGLDQRATIILMSDHGEAFQEQGFLQHDRLFTPVTRIPLIIRPPGGVEETVISSVVESIDLMPTLLEGIGAPIPPTVQGQSFLPLLRGEPMRPRPAISESPSYQGKGETRWDERSIVWEAHQFTGVFDETDNLMPFGRMLFDLNVDPQALHDVLPESHEAENEMRDLLQQWKTAIHRRGPLKSTVVSVDEKLEAELRALGYVQ